MLVFSGVPGRNYAGSLAEAQIRLIERGGTAADRPREGRALLDR
jgi:hypothetical protein